MKQALWIVGLLAIALPAYANLPPAPPMLGGEILILPIMVLFTALAGGYTIRRRLYGTSLSRRIGRVALVTVIIVFSAVQEVFGFLVLVTFSLIAIGRAIQLIVWGIRAGRPNRPEYLAGAHPRRLTVAGAVLLPLAIFMGGLAPAFISYWSPSPQDRVAALRKFVALQMAMQSPRAAELASNRERYESDLLDMMQLSHGKERRVILRRGSAGRFIILALPQSRRFPFFPYNYLVSEPSYRADESGAIRMVYVHERNAECPPNAPVVLRVEKGDVEDVLRGKVLPEFR